MKKKKKNSKVLLSLATFLVFISNLLSPVIVQAKDLVKTKNITISIERRVLGEEDIVTTKEIELKGENERTSEVFDRVMKEAGLKYENTGSVSSAFYVSSIQDKDGKALGEFDHGQSSGWMYSVNNDFKKVGMSDYYVKAGDVLRIAYTAKDFGRDIVAVDKIHELREALKNAKAINKDEYTEESYRNLESEIEKAKKYDYSDEEIGKMMSNELGDGDADTEVLISGVEVQLGALKSAIDNLEKKPIVTPDEEAPKEDIAINLFKWSDSNFNTIYFEKGQESINVLLNGMDSTKEVWLNDKKLTPIDNKYVVTLKRGLNIFKFNSVWATEEVQIPCITLPYTIEGNLVPGSKVKIKFEGLEESVKNTPGKYELKKSQMTYKSNIPGLASIKSEMISGATPDREKLSTMEFTIPKDVEPGEYTLTDGAMYHEWGKTSIGGYMRGNFSIFPEIKINIENKIPDEKIQDINLNTWTEFDKVYTVDDKAYVRVNDEAKSIIELTPGTNKVQVNGKEYSIECEKISYKVLNANGITPGSTVKIKFDGIKEAFRYISGEYNPNAIKTVYNTDIEGIKTVQSEVAGNFNSVNYEKLNYIEFTLPEDIKPGEYNLSNGGVYQSWWGQEINGCESAGNDGYKRNFSILPNVKFNVVETASEDTEAPVITTTLKDTQEVTKSNFGFKVSVLDNEDGRVNPVVKFEGETLNHNGSDYYTVRLVDGENIITVEATDKAGNTVAKEYKVNLKAVLAEGSSIILDTLSLELNKGEKHQLIAVDADDKRSSEYDVTARMIYEVIEGKDNVKVNKAGEVEALNYGQAKISVKYPGLKNPAIVQVNVKDKTENNPEIVTNIMNKYDTFYFNDDASKYNFKVEAKDANEVIVKVNGNVISGKDASYSTALNEGYNTIEVVAKKGSIENVKLYTVKAKKLEMTIKNISNEGNEIVQGDKVRVEFKGLETPVPKFLRVYNPKNTRVNYSTNMPGMTDIDGKATQYDIATKNAIEFTATRAGEITFSNGAIDEDWWGDVLYSERGIDGLPPNLDASVRTGRFSSLPSFTIKVKENPEFKDRFNPVVENAHNLKAGEEVTLSIPDMIMPDTGKCDILQAYTKFNTDIKGLEEISTADASKDEAILKTIKFTLPKDIKPGTYTITNGRVFKEYDDYRGIWKDAEFFKGEIPEIKIIVKDENEESKPSISEETKKKIEEGMNLASKWTLQNVTNPSYEDEWDILGLIRGDIKVPAGYYDTYYKNLEEVVIEKKGNLSRNKYTEYSRVIIALSALDKDPTNVGGYNLLEKLYDFKNVSKQGINGMIYALIALDTKNYELPKDANNSREKLIDGIISRQLEDGGFALSGKKGDADITAMALQALAKYKAEEKVKESIDKAVKFLSETQLSNGGYGSVDGENLESAAQVLVALNALNIDLNDSRFVKGNRNLVDVIMEYKAEDGGFKHLLSASNVDGMATEQALYALASQDRIIKGKTSLYNMNEVTDEKPDGDEDSKPGVDDNQKPDGDEDSKPEVDDNQKPDGNEDNKPGVDDNEKPDGNEDSKPEVDKNEKPDGNEDNKPEVDKNEKPNGDEDKKPEADQDKKPNNSGLPQTGSPIAIVLSILGITSIAAGAKLRRK